MEFYMAPHTRQRLVHPNRVVGLTSRIDSDSNYLIVEARQVAKYLNDMQTVATDQIDTFRATVHTVGTTGWGTYIFSRKIDQANAGDFDEVPDLTSEQMTDIRGGRLSVWKRAYKVITSSNGDSITEKLGRDYSGKFTPFWGASKDLKEYFAREEVAGASMITVVSNAGSRDNLILALSMAKKWRDWDTTVKK